MRNLTILLEYINTEQFHQVFKMLREYENVRN